MDNNNNNNIKVLVVVVCLVVRMFASYLQDAGSTEFGCV